MIDDIEGSSILHTKFTDPMMLNSALIPVDTRIILGNLTESIPYVAVDIDTGLTSALGVSVEVSADGTVDYTQYTENHTASITEDSQIETIANDYNLPAGHIPVAIPCKYDDGEQRFCYDTVTVTISDSENSTTFNVSLEKDY